MSSKQQYHTQMLASVLAQQEEEAQYFGIDFVQLCHADHKKLM